VSIEKSSDLIRNRTPDLPDSSIVPQPTTRPRALFVYYLFIFIYLNIRGGVHTGSTRHCGHYWPIVPAPGDCEDGEFGGMNSFGRGNRSTVTSTKLGPLGMNYWKA
jgi:hypothetical protein